MAIFPSDKTQPFVAENGVIYVYEDDRWRVKTYKVEEDGRLPYRIETDKVLRIGDTTPQSTTAEVQLVDNQDNFSNVRFTGTNGVVVTSDAQGITFDGAALMGDIALELDDYETKVDSQAGDQNLQNQIDDLSVSKGKVARYKIENVIGTPVARPGQLSVNTTFPNNVVLVSFGVEDLDGVLTKPMATGDIIEFVDAASSKVSRYRITDAAGAPTGVGVEYISGNNDFVKDQEEQVYIYPQNASGASKDYVDAQDNLKLNLTGGTLTNSLTFKRGNKATSQFGIEPNSGTSDTNIYVFNDGQMRLRSSHTSSIDDRVGSHIVLDPNGGVPLTKIYNVVEPTNDTMAANKLYVDNATSGKLIPPGLRFDYANAETAAVGQLAYFEDAGGLRMRLHKTSKDITWNQGGPVADVTYSEGHMFTIYNIVSSGSWNIIRTGTINRIDWHDSDILCYVSSHQTNGTFSTNKTYYVTIAGIC